MVIPRWRSSGAESILREIALLVQIRVLVSKHLGNGGGQRGLTVVNVTNGADVDVRLGPLELCLCHRFLLETFTEDVPRPHGSRTKLVQVYWGLSEMFKFWLAAGSNLGFVSLPGGAGSDFPAPAPSCGHSPEIRVHGQFLLRIDYSPRDFWMISSATAFGTSA